MGIFRIKFIEFCYKLCVVQDTMTHVFTSMQCVMEGVLRMSVWWLRHVGCITGFVLWMWLLMLFLILPFLFQQPPSR